MADTPEIRDEGYYWVVLGQNPPEVAYWERDARSPRSSPRTAEGPGCD
jgi:hypothetical protein